MLFTALAVLAMIVLGFGVIARGTLAGWQRPQLLLVPAEALERSGQASFDREISQARGEGKLIERSAEFNRLDGIVRRVVNAARSVYEPAQAWAWQWAFIDAAAINANQRPTARLVFYAGLWRGLKLSDDEFAVVVGHECAHALREHCREVASHASIGQALHQHLRLAKYLPKPLLDGLANLGFALPFSRQCELEADALGMELAARSGFSAAAALTLWKKFEQASGEHKDEYLSTHPAYALRRDQAQKVLKALHPLS